MRALIFAVASFVIAVPAHATSSGFFSAVDDLPLMQGLRETGGAPFETAQGRIVRVSAEGAVDPADVAVFYARTLPQLGWRPDETRGLTFLRGGETLEVHIEDRAFGRARATFLITPTPSASPPAR